MRQTPQERAVLDQVVANFKENGFEVFLEPSDQILPKVLAGNRPDAIAIRNSEKIVIVIATDDSISSRRMEAITQKLAYQSEWQLRVFSITKTASDSALPEMANEIIEKSVANVEMLIGEGQLPAALLLGWATLESVGRSILRSTVARPQTPARLIQVMVANDIVDPDSADLLRALGLKRNRVIHGDFSAEISASEVQRLATVLKLLIQDMPA